MKRTRILAISMLLILSLMLGACDSGNTETAVTTPAIVQTSATTAPVMTTTTATTPATTASQTTATSILTETTVPTEVPSVDPTPGIEAGYNPLTGLKVADPARAAKRPVAIMINNIKVATPQLGINAADLYYEMVVEGGITRMLVVFSDPAKVPELGSIRSVRNDYIDYAGGIDAILVSVGGSSIAIDQINRQKAAHIDMSDQPQAFWRDPAWREDRGVEHSVRTTGKRLTEAIARMKLRDTLKDPKKSAFGFLPEGTIAPASDKAKNPALTVTLRFSNYNTSEFRYDERTGLYSKSQFGKPQIDLADNQPLKVTNVLVLRTTIRSVDGTSWRDADLSAGSGYYISGGARLPIKWKKGATTDPFIFTREDGSPLLINRGKTYVCVQSVNEPVTFK